MENRNKQIVSLALAGVLTTGLPAMAYANDEPTTAIYQTQEEFSEYTIEEGDTLGSIAERLYGNAAYWEQLALYNNLENPNVLHVGQVIRIPGSLSSLATYEIEYDMPTTYEEDMTYTVQAGDTLSCIARKFYETDDLLTVDRLATYNDLWDPNKIDVDEILLIPCKEKLALIVPNDYTEEYRQMAWRLEHPNCPMEKEKAFWFVWPDNPCEKPCPEPIPHHHEHHHKLVLKP